MLCSSCKKNKLNSEFYFDKTKGRRSYCCKVCHRARAKAWRDKQPQGKLSREALARNRKNRRLISEFIRTYKSGKPCADCGKPYPYYVMDFDHVRGKKKIIIAHLRSHLGMAGLLKEIEKCDLVCSNCHRIRTFQRKHGRQHQHAA